MKTILYIHQYFKTPGEGGALRSYFIAKGLVERGYQVQMISAHNSRGYQQKTIEGIRVHYLPVRYSNNMPFISRYFAFLKFVVAAIRLVPKLPPFDLVYATSTPLTVGMVALWIKWRKKTPYIFEVRDLWPEAPIQMGALRSVIARKLAYYLEAKTYRHARSIIALSPGIAADIRASSPGPEICTIPNMADTGYFNKNPQPNQVCTIGYFGAFGLANDVEFIIKIAHFSQQHKSKVRFLVAGEGIQKDFLLKAISKYKLDNIEVLSHQNRAGIKSLMDKVDAVLVTFLNLPVLETNSPNKFFDGLAAGKLCIVNTRGWLKELVEKHKCGFYVDPKEPEQFPNLIRPFTEEKGLLAKYQQNARALAENQFSKEILVAAVCGEIKKAFP